MADWKTYDLKKPTRFDRELYRRWIFAECHRREDPIAALGRKYASLPPEVAAGCILGAQRMAGWDTPSNSLQHEVCQQLENVRALFWFCAHRQHEALTIADLDNLVTAENCAEVYAALQKLFAPPTTAEYARQIDAARKAMEAACKKEQARA